MTPLTHPPLNERRRPHAARTLHAWLLLAMLLVRLEGVGATNPAPVVAELVIPPAEAYVIGDVIPLFWRFTNGGGEPLGFMWEGCCRLNGRLNVTAQGKPIDLIPPGQALAHMFAKAEVLPPGKGRDFDTRLSDWVRLRASGTYTLAGEYVGVRPEQRPQVPRGTKLWREAAATPPIEVTVLSVADYLEQRPRRSAARGVALELSGSRRLPPLQPTPLQLRLRNAGSEPVKLTWPNDFQLWIVDREGHRPGPGGLLVEGAYEELTLAPGAEVVHPVPFHSDLFEGEPFGDYQVFVDLQDGGRGKPRVPSSAVPVRWELTADDVATLVNQAAAGPKAGLRNAPLKLLRTYVGELRPTLTGLDPARLAPAAAPLLEQLRLAACLKPSAPKPGRVPVRIALSPEGRATLADAPMAGCLGGTSGGLTHELATLLQVRRHLGWELALQLEPAAGTPLGTVLAQAGALRAVGGEWATEPQAVFAGANTNAPGTITFRREPVPDPMVLRVRGSGEALRLEWARRSTAAEPPEALRFEPLPDRATLHSRLAGLTAGQLLVMGAPEVTWAEVVEILRPALGQGAQVDLCATP